MTPTYFKRSEVNINDNTLYLDYIIILAVIIISVLFTVLKLSQIYDLSASV